MSDLESFYLIGPQVALIIGALVVLLVGLWTRNEKTLLGLTLLTLIGSFAIYGPIWNVEPASLFGGLLAFDPLSKFLGAFSILTLVLVVLFSSKSKEILAERKADYYSILLALGSGLMFMASATNLLMIYLALETVSILSYTLAGFHREKYASNEASMKYVIYGALASGVMVYGMSLLFGITGSIELSEIRMFLSGANEVPALLWVSTIMVFAGIGYKISAFPMHMWTPDVYEGAPTPVTALFSVAPKAAGFALLIRFFVTGFSTSTDGIDLAILGDFSWPKLMMISSVLTMFVGNLTALAQTSVKRLLAYSAIAHAGYMLMGASTGSMNGLMPILFYLVVYCLMNIGAFWICAKVEEVFGNDDIKNFKGLVRTKPFYAVCMTVFMFSLIGLPPFAGFIGKYLLFSAVLEKNMYSFVIIAGLNSVISLYYYMRVVKAMVLEKEEVAMPAGITAFDSTGSKVFVGALAAPNLFLGLGIFLEPILRITREASQLYLGG